jgi:hypothetical protein
MEDGGADGGHFAAVRWGLFDHYFVMQTMGMSPDIVVGILSGEIADSVGLWLEIPGPDRRILWRVDPAVDGGGADADHRLGLFRKALPYLRETP